MRRAWGIWGIGVAAGVLALLVACSGNGDDAGDAANATEVAPPPGEAVPADEGGAAEATVAPELQTTEGAASAAPETTVAVGTDGAAAGAETGSPDLQAVSVGRSIVFTATLDIEVPDVTAATEQARAVLAGLGGLTFGQDSVTDPEPRAVLTVKVPPEHFDEALARLRELGDVIRQTVTADDVTEAIVDLESRIRTAEASVERLRAFLEDAGSVEAVAALETQLLQRETELEVLRGQLRTLQDQVSLATIVLTLTQPGPPVPEPAVTVTETAYAGHDGGSGCPGAGEATLEEGDEMTTCVVVVNAGNTPLGSVEVDDPGLALENDDAILVGGDPAVAVEPGQQVVLAWSHIAQPGRTPAPVVRADPLDPQSEPLHVQVAAEVTAVELVVDADDSLPGFGDAVAAGWHALQRVLGLALVFAGALLPFAWLAAIAVVVWLVVRRRRGRPAVG